MLAQDCPTLAVVCPACILGGSCSILHFGYERLSAVGIGLTNWRLVCGGRNLDWFGLDWFGFDRFGRRSCNWWNVSRRWRNLDCYAKHPI
jgi:hypothetical protein